VLRAAGADTRAAGSAEEALGILDAFGAEVVLSDIGMPDKDGYWLLDAIRRDRPDLRVVALTAYARSEDRRRAERAGFDAYVTKPVEPDQLVRVLAPSAAS